MLNMDVQVDSERIEEYLEAIYKEQSKGQAVSASVLAKNLDVSAPTVRNISYDDCFELPQRLWITRNCPQLTSAEVF